MLKKQLDLFARGHIPFLANQKFQEFLVVQHPSGPLQVFEGVAIPGLEGGCHEVFRRPDGSVEVSFHVFLKYDGPELVVLAYSRVSCAFRCIARVCEG